MNWRNGGHIMHEYRTPITTSDNGVVTSVALDDDWIVVGLTNCRINVYNARTGVFNRSLVGHRLGVWAVILVSRGGFWGGEEGETTCGLASRPYKRYEKGAAVVGEVEAGLDMLSLREDVGTSGVDHEMRSQLLIALGLGKARVRPPSVVSGEGVGKKSDVCCSSEGWGQPNALVVSGGCDKELRVWDTKSG
jgi:F-box and WD-40 domain protein CDC4